MASTGCGCLRGDGARRLGGPAFSLLLLAALAGTAHANDMGMFRLNAKGEALFTAMFWAYSPAVWLVEGAVLDRFLHIGYWRCFGLATAANVASTIVSAIWYFNSVNGTGWKTAWVMGNTDQLGALLLRSYLVTTAVEAIVVLLIMGKRLDSRKGVGAVAAANGVSFALSIAMMIYLTRGLS